MSWLTYKKNLKRLFGIDLDKENKKKVVLNFKKLTEDAVIPTYAHDGDIGMDLTATGVEYNEEFDMYVYHTGLSVATDKEYGVFIFPRSSNRRTESYLTNSVGVIDSFLYRGELLLCFKNRTSLSERIKTLKLENQFGELVKSIRNSNSLKKLQDKIRNINTVSVESNPMNFAPYEVGERIGQIVVFPVTQTQSVLLKELNSTIRNDGGFGSSGK